MKELIKKLDNILKQQEKILRILERGDTKQKVVEDSNPEIQKLKEELRAIEESEKHEKQIKELKQKIKNKKGLTVLGINFQRE